MTKIKLGIVAVILLMSNLVYPMTRAFYGKQVREPFAAEFSFSGKVSCSGR